MKKSPLLQWPTVIYSNALGLEGPYTEKNWIYNAHLIFTLDSIKRSLEVAFFLLVGTCSVLLCAGGLWFFPLLNHSWFLAVRDSCVHM